jgi:hypothetical protein
MKRAKDKAHPWKVCVMGVVYNAGRGLVIAGIVALVVSAVNYSLDIMPVSNAVSGYSYLFLLSGVITIAVSTKVDFLGSKEDERDQNSEKVTKSDAPGNDRKREEAAGDAKGSGRN